MVNICDHSYCVIQIVHDILVYIGKVSYFGEHGICRAQFNFVAMALTCLFQFTLLLILTPRDFSE